MKCKNCGKEMLKLIEVGNRMPITIYVCPNVSLTITNMKIGRAGNIYCEKVK